MRPPFRCLWCEELVIPGDLMHSLLPGYHYACAVRATHGPLAHLQGQCSCVVEASVDHDPPGITKRQAARLVADYVNSQQHDRPIQPGRN